MLHSKKYILFFLIFGIVVATPCESVLELIFGKTSEHNSKSESITGNLGGVSVSIPRYFADSLEFNGDPSFGQRRVENISKKSKQLIIRSFGFYVRYPDMEGLSDEKLQKNKEGYKLTTTPWIFVGLNSGENYPGDGFMERRLTAVLQPSADKPIYENYEIKNETEYGLVVYVARGVDPLTKLPYRQHKNAQDVFVHKDSSGRIDTYIRCSNRPAPAQPCQHTFDLLPRSRSVVYVNYRREELKNWVGIQRSIRALILGFEIK